MSFSKHMVCFTKQYCTDIIKLFLLPFITNVQRLNTGILEVKLSPSTSLKMTT